jgi:hypothetical protein
MEVIHLECVPHDGGDRPFVYVYDTDTFYIAVDTGHHEDLINKIEASYDKEIWMRHVLAGERLFYVTMGADIVLLRTYLSNTPVPDELIPVLQKEFPGLEIYAYDENYAMHKIAADVYQFPLNPAMQWVLNDIAVEKQHKQEDLLTPEEAANTLRTKGKLAFGYYDGNLEFGEQPRQLAGRHFNEVQPGSNRWNNDVPQFYGNLNFDPETNTLTLDHYDFVGTQHWEQTEVPGLALGKLNEWLSSNGFPTTRWQTNKFVRLAASPDDFPHTGEYDAYPDEYDPSYYKTAGLPVGGPFGWVNGAFLAGGGHHQAIIAMLMKHGWTWEDLFTARQAWGWLSITSEYGRGGSGERYLSISFSSDAGMQNDVEDCMQDLANRYKLPAKDDYGGEWHGVTDEDNYGAGLSGKEYLEHQMTRDINLMGDPIPVPPSQQKPPRPDWLPDNLHVVPTKFPPPRMANPYRDEFIQGNPFKQQRGYDSHNFISFIYLGDTDDLWIGSWGNNHDEILAHHLSEDWEQNPEAVIELLKPSTVFGQIWEEEDEDGPEYRIDINASDVLDELNEAGELTDATEDWRDIPGENSLAKARAKVAEWLQENAQSAGRPIHIAAIWPFNNKIDTAGLNVIEVPLKSHSGGDIPFVLVDGTTLYIAKDTGRHPDLIEAIATTDPSIWEKGYDNIDGTYDGTADVIAGEVVQTRAGFTYRFKPFAIEIRQQ